MKSTVQFCISHDTDGYTAAGADIALGTQVDTLDELMVNIREAVTLHFEDEDLAELGYVAEPAVVANVEVPQPANCQALKW